MSETQSTHFKGKDVVGHVAEARASGLIAAAEIHGLEAPGHYSAAADAARESALVFILLWTFFLTFTRDLGLSLIFLSIFSAGWILWKTGRSAWIGWSRLERLHRLIAQERWEIEHNRGQERDELRVLYAAKGFEGALLEEVLDVLMADGDRLLKVMVEEELGLRLENYQHPLKQSLGAAVGCIVTFALCFIGWVVHPQWGVIIGSLLAITIAAALSAYLDRNQFIRAIIWNLGIGGLAWGTVYFLIDFIFSKG